jgi:hypothetical protein
MKKTMRMGCESILKSIDEGKEINSTKTIRALLKTVMSLSNSVDELLYEIRDTLLEEDYDDGHKDTSENPPGNIGDIFGKLFSGKAGKT